MLKTAKVTATVPSPGTSQFSNWRVRFRYWYYDGNTEQHKTHQVTEIWCGTLEQVLCKIRDRIAHEGTVFLSLQPHTSIVDLSRDPPDSKFAAY